MAEKKPENVYDKIASVTGELAKTGIAKSRRNQQQGYQFRGIDEVYAALSPLLAKHRLNILPRVLHREVIERTTQRGGALFNVTVEVEFDFVSADDGTSHTVRTFGEAMDSADKATNKAMSAAYKYAAFMTFAIPTEGDNDADATTHEVASHGSGTGTTPEEGKVSPTAPKRQAHSALKTKLRAFVHDMEGCGDWDTWVGLRESHQDLIKEVREKLPEWWEGGPNMPEEFVPLHRRIEILEANLAEDKARLINAG